MESDAVLDMNHAASQSDTGSDNIPIHAGIVVGEAQESGRSSSNSYVSLVGQAQKHTCVNVR